MSETDGVPVLLKHLPDWESRKATARMLHTAEGLKAAFGDTAVINAIEFVPGTEAVTADYGAGRLLIVEYAAPQPSIETDTRIREAIEMSGSSNTITRRVGNYNVVVFDAQSSRSANALIDEVKYEKQITWLGNNPFAISAERAFVLTTSDIFMSTLLVIVGGIVFSIIGGLLVGFVYFAMRDRRRAAITTYTDGGGMTRLNLDGFTPEMSQERMLGE